MICCDTSRAGSRKKVLFILVFLLASLIVVKEIMRQMDKLGIFFSLSLARFSSRFCAH